MPSRWLTATIVFFWLATTGWLFWHDLWPEWQPGEPPPFHIDLVEEVQRGTPKTAWTVSRDQGEGKGVQGVFTALTWAEYHQEDDTFSLHAEFKALQIGQNISRLSLRLPLIKVEIDVKRMKSEYRVNRQGQLQLLRADIEGELHGEGGALAAEASLWGEVHDEQFFAHYRLRALDAPLEGDLKPVPVSYHSSILMPLHPVNRIHGLHAGRTWRQPLVDPFRDAVPGLASGVHYLQARVLDQPQVLDVGLHKTATCLVIDYTAEDMSAKTWVQQDSERVQRQEFTIGKERWIIQRDIANKSLFSNRNAPAAVEPPASEQP